MSEWADQYRVLSPESSAEPGKWHTSRAPYQRGMMDAFSDPAVETVVLMTSAQVGKTEVLNNVVGFYIDQDPAPLLVMQPNERPMGHAWSMDRLTPMLRDTPRLHGKVREPKSRDPGNTILHKVFAGGHITVVGANSPAGLASRPIRILLCDEVDRYPESAGGEGDPIELANRRTDTFWNRKRLLTSTPTLKKLSRIEAAWEESDQRHYFVPCPACRHYQRLIWANLKYELDEARHCTHAAYACEACGVLLEESDKHAMLQGGEWRAEKPGRRIAGFHLNALYSPWKRWPDMVNEWVEAQQDVSRLQVFINTLLGESFEERAGSMDPVGLQERCEPYPKAEDGGLLVPAPVGLLTCGVDVQDDRLEAIVRGWAGLEESYLIAREFFLGDPGEGDVWRQLDAFLLRDWIHEHGAKLKIDTTCIDSGAHTDEVYRFCAVRYARRVYPVKGYSQPGKPLVSRKPVRNNKARARVFMVGTDAAKDTIYSRLKIQTPGAGYLHFPSGTEAEYFQQLTAEKVKKEQVRGRWVRRYLLPRGQRNEALDCEVYALVALALARVPRDQLGAMAASLKPDTPAGEPPRTGETPDTSPTQERLRSMLRRPPRGWISGLS